MQYRQTLCKHAGDASPYCYCNNRLCHTDLLYAVSHFQPEVNDIRIIIST